MDKELLAPCGINCAVCAAYLARVHNLKEKGIRYPYCEGCRPRGKQCAFLKKRCERLLQGTVRFCFECPQFPCRSLETLDARYRRKYHMSMVENLRFIKAHGVESFLEAEREKWRCPYCGGVISCHNGLCFSCQQEKLRTQKERFHWKNGKKEK